MTIVEIIIFFDSIECVIWLFQNLKYYSFNLQQFNLNFGYPEQQIYFRS